MKLLYSPSSPYVRKVIMVATELGLNDRITLEPASANPLKPNDAVFAINPVGKIPALILENGLCLFDSPVICEYLTSLVAGQTLLAASGNARWVALRDEAMADGLLDAALLSRYETMRPENAQFAGWTDGQMHKVTATLNALEHGAAALDARVDVGTITISCALGYLDFRYDALNWRGSRPTLAKWFDTFAARPSFADSKPG